MHSALNVATLLSEQSVETVVTVRLVPLLLEGSFVELFQAEAGNVRVNQSVFIRKSLWPYFHESLNFEELSYYYLTV